jgi:diguanylate cyclase (GGDEF)-like protein/PAS domain S-box-containing protein
MNDQDNPNLSKQDILAELDQVKAEHHALLESARSILQYQDFETAAREIFQFCKLITGATSGYVALLSSDGEENEVLFLDAGDRPCSVDESLPMPIRGLREVAYRTLKGVYDNNFSESKWVDFMPGGHMRLDNVLFAPLVFDSSAVGLIGLANKAGGFDERDVDFVSALSDIAALALRNNRNLDLLKKSEEKYRIIAEYTTDVIWIFNLTRQVFTYISPSIIHLRGYTPEEAMAQTMEESLTEESVVKIAEAINTYVPQFIKDPSSVQSYIVEIQQPCKNGDLIWVEVSSRLRYNNQNEIEVVGVSRNIEQRKEQEQKIIYLSLHDQLTGLYNRHYFVNELERLSGSRDYPIAIISADLDNLKSINDSLGHSEGDLYLKACANIFKDSLRNYDLLARVGGDEFALVLPRTERQSAEIIIRRIRDQIENYNKKHSGTPLSISIGLAISDSLDQPLTEAFNEADRLMYEEKRDKK